MNASVIELNEVSHVYRGPKALDSVDLSLRAGQVTALLGPNGAGKTTLIHLLLGLLPVQSGRIRVLGQSPAAAARSGQWGAMLQSSGVQDTLTVSELLQLFGSLYVDPAPARGLIEEAGLGGLEHRRFAALSGGQKQRVLFALALVGRPRLLILDEPTTGLDPVARRGMWQAIERRRAEGLSILLCTHYLDEAEILADQVVVLNKGRILAKGSVDDIKARMPNAQIQAASSLPEARIAALPGVQRVESTDRRWNVLSADASATLRAWLSADPGLHDLDVRSADLETAFINLTTTQEMAA
ncbi:ABC transporter ATP-binding protein [Wenzhouxiangella marina]|uniref:ABC transporter ATPase n=1 Tax=Wenzhouxiangella marina TaxID=1579979 RepID=A0A0K0XUI0_9GAMM|nr:ABC transporter ATP-binding protein [Wenzhouxiangella marina]AKS41320.1 ABC transporter ATPase [Wenzhouxiangella marina]MBB6086930.1 ABC-2 type transport system ATP-binding protein [Wenzhouxiangella marina]